MPRVATFPRACFKLLEQTKVPLPLSSREKNGFAATTVRLISTEIYQRDLDEISSPLCVKIKIKLKYSKEREIYIHYKRVNITFSFLFFI